MENILYFSNLAGVHIFSPLSLFLFLFFSLCLSINLAPTSLNISEHFSSITLSFALMHITSLLTPSSLAPET